MNDDQMMVEVENGVLLATLRGLPLKDAEKLFADAVVVIRRDMLNTTIKMLEGPAFGGTTTCAGVASLIRGLMTS